MYTNTGTLKFDDEDYLSDSRSIVDDSGGLEVEGTGRQQTSQHQLDTSYTPAEARATVRLATMEGMVMTLMNQVVKKATARRVTKI